MTATKGIAAARRPTTSFGGWPIVGWSAIVLVLMVAAILAAYGSGEGGLRTVVRATAQTSLLLFLGAFSASSMHALWPTAATRWLLANRRYVGVSFSVSHALHLLAILTIALRFPEVAISRVTAIGGGLGYVFIAAMVATSFDRTAAWLGPRRWHLLHATGMYYLWTIFFVSVLPRAITSATYVPIALLLLAAIGLRVSVWIRRRA